MSVPYYPMYPSDFEAKTSHLNLEEDGAYNRMLRLAWMTPGCSLPDDKAFLMRRLKVDEATFDRVILPLINEFFTRQNGRILNKRLREEFQKADETYKRRSKAGKMGGRPKAIDNKEKDPKQSLSNPKAGPKQPEPEPEPEPEPVEESVGRISIEIPPPPSSVVAGFFADLRQAVGLAGDAQIPGWRDADLAGLVSEWQALGLTEDRIITEAEASRDVHPEPPALPKALTPWMQRAAARIPTPPVAPKLSPQEAHAAALKTRAEWIAKGTCPPSMVSVSQAGELLAKGMVTPDQLRKCGIVA